MLSLSGGNLVELAYSNGSASASGINFASSSELGKTWSTPVSVVDDGDNNVAPSIATDAAGDAWISWLDVTSGVVKVSATKDGKTFSPPVTIVSSGATLVMTPPYDSLALDRSTGNLYMATTGKSTRSNPILMRSTDLGLTWSAGATFTGDGSPSIAVGNPNNVFLTYNVTVTTPAGTAEQRNIALSTDGGTVFSNLGIIRTAAPGNSLEFTPGSLVLFPLSPSGNYAFGEFGAEAHPGTPGTLSSFVSSGVVSGAFPPVEETPIGFFYGTSGNVFFPISGFFYADGSPFIGFAPDRPNSAGSPNHFYLVQIVMFTGPTTSWPIPITSVWNTFAVDNANGAAFVVEQGTSHTIVPGYCR